MHSVHLDLFKYFQTRLNMKLVRMVWAGLLKEPLEVVRGRHRRTLVTARGG
jgi:hypothetical protein